MANYAGLLFNGQEVLSTEVFNASPSSVLPEWCVSPSSTLVVTHSQKDKETCFDPIKCLEKQQTEAKSVPKSKETPIPMLSNLILVNASVQLTPQAFNLWPPAVQSTPQAFNLQPPAANTEDVFKNHQMASSKTKDMDMKDVNSKAKSAPSYHFTSDIWPSCKSWSAM